MSLLALVLLCMQASNRLWWADLELEGPSGPVTFTAPEDGSTHVQLELFDGEELATPVPVPLFTPLGETGLTTATIPGTGPGEDRGEDRGESGGARLSWSSSQSAPALAVRYRPFLLRTRPTPPRTRTYARTADLAVLVGATLLALALRRRPGWLFAATLTGSAGLALLALRQTPAPTTLTLLEVDAERSLAAEIEVARDRLELRRPEVWLEAEPEDARLAFDYDPSDRRLVVEAADPGGATLRALRGAEVPEVTSRRNAWRDLEQVWTRGPEGAWQVHGAWRAEAALAAGRDPEGGEAGPPEGGPPGWLASGLPPGRGVLLARVREPQGTFWVRITGWEP